MTSEMKRKAVHIGNGFWVFTLAFLPRLAAVVVVLVALFLVLVVFRPKVYNAAFETMARPRDYEAGILIGPTLYILVVLFVVLIFDFRVAAATFAMLAFGDGSATVVGTNFGKHKTRSGKSWEGFAAFVIFGFVFTTSAFFVVDFFQKNGEAGWVLISELIVEKLPDEMLILALIFGITVLAAFVELYLSQYVDDNILVPLTTSICLTLALILL
ncbi:MAG: diacylglycerol/polyprenol kinase family protein [Candidatus Hodarchaeota archaeon]